MKYPLGSEKYPQVLGAIAKQLPGDLRNPLQLSPPHLFLRPQPRTYCTLPDSWKLHSRENLLLAPICMHASLNLKSLSQIPAWSLLVPPLTSFLNNLSQLLRCPLVGFGATFSWVCSSALVLVHCISQRIFNFQVVQLPHWKKW